MRRVYSCFRSRAKHQAFTLIELLVIVVLVGFLVCLCLPALGNATNQTKRAQCASNLRQFTLAMHIFANDNEDRFPNNNAGFWAWNISPEIGSFVESTGSKWTVMYCPGTSPRFSESDNWYLYNYGPYRVLGYAVTFPGTPSVLPANSNPMLAPAPVQIGFGVYVTPLASERVLLADVTMSAPGQNNPAARYSYNYNYIQGGYAKGHLSAHLIGQFPAGGNLGMLDGHVEWRKFDVMNPQTYGPSPVFWW